MPGGRRRIRGAVGAWCAAALLLVLSGCAGGAAAPPDTTRADIQRTLDARAADERRRLADVPLSSWEYRLSEVRRTGDRATAQAQLRYRIDGYDAAPVSTTRTLELRRSGQEGDWYVTADRAGPGGAQQLWQQGDVDVVRGTRSLVLGAGQDPARLRAIAAEADRAVPAVSAAWPEKWAGRVVVLVPPSLDAMGALLSAPAASYRGIAAVTTGTRVIVNPEAYESLSELGRRVVLTHETTHVATRPHTTSATPMWLSEGFADWAAFRGTGRTAAQTAPELRRSVRGGAVPAALPADAAFGFGTDADALARAYQGSWLACELIADRWGPRALTDLYRSVGKGAGLESALRDVLGTTVEGFTGEWRGYVRGRLR
ncbi:hypothetical protein [Streptomyces sp. NPDC000410]|uniref:hypothetical protein n=1 Tax=Streptomyces sp. NPDC000410 TaxID=3154254 RepID=UPI003327D13A